MSSQREAFGETSADGIFVPNETLARFWNCANGTPTADERDQKPILGPTEKPASVRIATKNDEPAILALLLLDLRENSLDQFQPIDKGTIMEHIRLGTERKGGIIGVIDDADGKPIACTILVPSKFWWTKAWHYTDIVTFVHPDHRRSHHAQDLIQFQKWNSDAFSQEFGYRVYVLMNVLASKQTKEKVRLFRRHATQSGASFVYPTPVVDGARK